MFHRSWLVLLGLAALGTSVAQGASSAGPAEIEQWVADLARDEIPGNAGTAEESLRGHLTEARPRLTRALAEGDSQQRRFAAELLMDPRAGFPPDEAFEVLISQIHTDQVAGNAGPAIRLLLNQTHVFDRWPAHARMRLIRALESPDAQMRFHAALILSGVASPDLAGPVVENLLPQLRTDDVEGNAERAWEAMLRLRTPWTEDAAAHLEDALDSSDGQLRLHAAQALASDCRHIPSPALVEELDGHLVAGVPDGFAIRACDVIVRAPSPLPRGALRGLENALHSTDAVQRRLAARIFLERQDLDPPDAVWYVVVENLRSDRPWSARDWAENRLWRFSGRPVPPVALSALERAVFSEDSCQRASATEVLVHLTGQAQSEPSPILVDALIDGLIPRARPGRPEWEWNQIPGGSERLAIGFFGEQFPGLATDRVTTLLRAPSEQTRFAAARILALSRRAQPIDRIVPPLVLNLRTDDELYNAGQALEALSRLPTPALGQLRPYADWQDDRQVRYGARIAIDNIVHTTRGEAGLRHSTEIGCFTDLDDVPPLPRDWAMLQ